MPTGTALRNPRRPGGDKFRKKRRGRGNRRSVPGAWARNRLCSALSALSCTVSSSHLLGCPFDRLVSSESLVADNFMQECYLCPIFSRRPFRPMADGASAACDLFSSCIGNCGFQVGKGSLGDGLTAGKRSVCRTAPCRGKIFLLKQTHSVV